MPRPQFTVRAGLLWVFVASLVCAIAVRFPRWATFVVLMPTLFLVPLGIASSARLALVRLTRTHVEHPRAASPHRFHAIVDALLRSLDALGLWVPEKAPSLLDGLMTAVLSAATIVGLWPALREVGLVFSLARIQPVGATWQFARSDLPDVLLSQGHWVRLWRWEAWSLGRWWLFFGAIFLLWRGLSWVFPSLRSGDRSMDAPARFLAFAPWFLVLEVACLVGVWVTTPNVVPEPSTGFVVGIFSWDLWHWDCWLDRTWLVRAAFPVWVVGSVFFLRVLRWR